jgi:hypothetical protein
MPYARDNRYVLAGCSWVLITAAAPFLLFYAFLWGGASAPAQCVLGQETHLRSTLKVKLPEEDLDELEQALSEIADRREMSFGTMSTPPSPSGRRGVAFDVCSREAYLRASRDLDDEGGFTIHISQAATAASGKQASLLADDVNAWIEQRRGR